MKPYGNIWRILYGFLAVCLLAACKSSTNITTSTAGITKTNEAFFESVLDNSFRFNTLSSRLKIDLYGQQKEISSRAQLKIVYDNLIQISIQPVLGIEMFRIEMNNDSIKILDRMNKQYVIDSYDNIKRYINVDFNFRNIQALLTNQMFIPGENDISINHFRRFRMSKNNNSAMLRLIDSNGMLYTFTANSDEKLLSTNIENGSNSYALNWDYENFQVVDNRLFPFNMIINLISDNNTQGKAKLTFSSPVINDPIKTDFIIPSGYNQVSTAQIIKMLEQR